MTEKSNIVDFEPYKNQFSFNGNTYHFRHPIREAVLEGVKDEIDLVGYSVFMSIHKEEKVIYICDAKGGVLELPVGGTTVIGLAQFLLQHLYDPGQLHENLLADQVIYTRVYDDE